ncbi:MAG: hypothetical protein AB1646_25755 [Thermodesulfobacteriota bacterium]
MSIQIDLNRLRPALAMLEKRLRTLNGSNVRVGRLVQDSGLIEDLTSAVVWPLIAAGVLVVNPTDFSVEVHWDGSHGPLEPVLGDGDHHD